ncbi:MAG: hypothetical protein R3254_07070 [Thiomicrorhabdus sp.]|nr:hypothetical protein [Thiomicrorhabdus sp.]
MSVTTCNEKVVQIIANTALEKKLKRTLKSVGVNGYTVFDVRGDGDTGFQGGHIEGDTNVLIMVVVPVNVSEELMWQLNQDYLKRGHHLMVFSFEADVLTPSKFG